MIYRAPFFSCSESSMTSFSFSFPNFILLLSNSFSHSPSLFILINPFLPLAHLFLSFISTINSKYSMEYLQSVMFLNCSKLNSNQNALLERPTGLRKYIHPTQLLTFYSVSFPFRPFSPLSNDFTEINFHYFSNSSGTHARTNKQKHIILYELAYYYTKSIEKLNSNGVAWISIFWDRCPSLPLRLRYILNYRK